MPRRSTFTCALLCSLWIFTGCATQNGTVIGGNITYVLLEADFAGWSIVSSNKQGAAAADLKSNATDTTIALPGEWKLVRRIPSAFTATTNQRSSDHLAGHTIDRGTATLVAGSATINNAWLSSAATSTIFLAVRSPAGAPGALSAPAAARKAMTANGGDGSFAINSSSPSEASVVDWVIVN